MTTARRLQLIAAICIEIQDPNRTFSSVRIFPSLASFANRLLKVSLGVAQSSMQPIAWLQRLG
jgi:hypothetical protein